MSNFHWSNYGAADKYGLDDLVMDEFVRIDGKMVKYPQNAEPKHFYSRDYSAGQALNADESILKDSKAIQHNSEVYDWLRKNPHRANMGILQLEVNGRVPKSGEISEIQSELDLLTGAFKTSYVIDGIQFEVMVSCQNKNFSAELSTNPFSAKHSNTQFKVKSAAFETGVAKLKLLRVLAGHTISGVDFPEKNFDADFAKARTIYLDLDAISNDNASNYLEFEVDFDRGTFSACNFAGLNPYIKRFWQDVKIIELTEQSKIMPNILPNILADTLVNTSPGILPDAFSSALPNVSRSDLLELERREVLSLYNLAIHSSGSLPPQETGLMCNSWYGKFHLEMHLWHASWAPLYGVSKLLEKSFAWYLESLPQARANAQRNGFKGCRWPKMVGPSGLDSPSIIAPLLVWQQSHIIFLLHLVYGDDLPSKYENLVKETADFMCDFLIYNAENDTYELCGPVIPAQEEFDPMTVLNPTFELVYWKHCLQLGQNMLRKAKTNVQDDLTLMKDIYSKIAVPKPVAGLFPSHENAPDTFPNFMKDHPMQLAILGLFNNEDMQTSENRTALKNTLDRVLKDWNEESMWGWDYGYMAMLAHALGDDDLAVKILLKSSPKNYYAANGHNFQKGRNDLPSYLPGNGALLWAIHTIWKGKQ